MKTTVPVNGTPTEIEIPDEQITAAGFQPTANFEKELSRRALSIAQKQGFRRPEDLLEDETFVQQVLDKKGIKPGATSADPADTAVAIQEALKKNRGEWENRELNPLRQKNEEYETREQQLLVKDLHRQIIQAAATMGVKKALLKSASRNAVPPIVSMTETSFGFDTDTGEFYVLDGEGFAFSDKPSKDRPYKDVEEFIEQWASNKENAEFVETTAQRGPGFQGAGGGRQGAGAVQISKADSRDLRKLMAARAEATKRGLSPYDGGVVIGD